MLGGKTFSALLRRKLSWTITESFHFTLNLVLLCEVGLIPRFVGSLLSIGRIQGNNHAARFLRLRKSGPVAKPIGKEQQHTWLAPGVLPIHVYSARDGEERGQIYGRYRHSEGTVFDG